ncbi:MAG: hypothetical protein AAGI37_13355 [Planctomycetota bacterium]
MPSGPDYILKIEGLATHQPHGPESSGVHTGRPWIAVKWSCCSVYSRIYRNRHGTAYEGGCPKCGQRARASIGPGGTNSRFFNAG